MAVNDLQAVLRLCHLVSPALPVGAYAYSQGLEYAVDAGWVHDEDAALNWLQGLSRNSIGTLDLPVLLRLHRAWECDDDAGLSRWNSYLLASRESSEMRSEERHLGGALARVLDTLGFAEPGIWVDRTPCYATMFSLAAVRWNIDPRDALGGYLWAWTENQVLAAVKLIPLGQSAGQRLLHRLLQSIPQIVESAVSRDDASIGVGCVSQPLASVLHESQYSRLFRS
jgi:urease accessory protein